MTIAATAWAKRVVDSITPNEKLFLWIMSDEADHRGVGGLRLERAAELCVMQPDMLRSVVQQMKVPNVHATVVERNGREYVVVKFPVGVE